MIGIYNQKPVLEKGEHDNTTLQLKEMAWAG
jgi:hypothetical protein